MIPVKAITISTTTALLPKRSGNLRFARGPNNPLLFFVRKSSFLGYWVEGGQVKNISGF